MRYKSITASEEASVSYSTKSEIYSSSLESDSRMLYMGGEAPSDDNVVSWIATVQGELAPTSYVLGSITDLFSLVSTVDESSAITKFEAALVTYC